MLHIVLFCHPDRTQYPLVSKHIPQRARITIAAPVPLLIGSTKPPTARTNLTPKLRRLHLPFYLGACVSLMAWLRVAIRSGARALHCVSSSSWFLLVTSIDSLHQGAMAAAGAAVTAPHKRQHQLPSCGFRSCVV